MTAAESYRSLDPEVEWPFFDPDFHHTSEAREAIQPLTQESAEILWRTHFSKSPIERHPMLLPQNHWLSPTTDGPNWVAEFNNTSREVSPSNSTIAAFLRDSFALPERDSLYFVTMREHAYRLPCWVAMACWACLLAIDDEGSVLFHADSGRFACFGPNGSLGFGVKLSAASSGAA